MIAIRRSTRLAALLAVSCAPFAVLLAQLTTASISRYCHGFDRRDGIERRRSAPSKCLRGPARRRLFRQQSQYRRPDHQSIHLSLGPATHF